MKKLLLLASMAIMLMFWTISASAQCTPDPLVTDPEGNGEMVPDTLEGWEGTPMNLTLSIICPTNAVVNTTSILLHHITIKSIGNKPAWMSYATNPASGEFAAGSLQCALVTGTPTVGSAGYTTMSVIVDVYANVGGMALLAATDYNSGMPMVLWIHPALGVDEMGNSGFGAIAPKPNPFNEQMHIGCYANDNRTASLKVMDMVGNLIYTETISTNVGENYFVFSGSELSNGIYFYTISDDRGNSTTKKMIKSE